MQKLWTDDAWDDYLYWQSNDKKTLKRINQLIKDIERNGNVGIGKSSRHLQRKNPNLPSSAPSARLFGYFSRKGKGAKDAKQKKK